MKQNKILLVILVLIGIIMIYLGIKAKMYPPALTGIGFFIIAYVFNQTFKGNQ